MSYDWIEMNQDALDRQPGRWIAVSDEVLTHCRPLVADETAAEAIRDYADSYDAGDDSGLVEVEWTIYQDGSVVDSGTSHFDPAKHQEQP